MSSTPIAILESDPELEALRKKLREAFHIFESEGIIDVEDLGNILRYLGLNPTQKQLETLKEEMADQFVPFEKFEAIISKIVLTSTYDGVGMARDTETTLLKAFEVLDPERKGYVDSEKMVRLLKTYGEPMNDEEINAFLKVAEDQQNKVIRYEEYVTKLSSQ
ncbi:hypothetical protein ABK040_006156 [Willaertia magna]